METKEGPTLGQAVKAVREIILGEEEAAIHGNAYLDPPQIAALKEVLSLGEEAVLQENIERDWAFNSERLKITLGVCGDAQEGSFTNATLQRTANDNDLEFSIAVHIEVPAKVNTQDELADYLGGIFGGVVHGWPQLHVEIQLGPCGDGEGEDDR